MHTPTLHSARRSRALHCTGLLIAVLAVTAGPLAGGTRAADLPEPVARVFAGRGASTAGFSAFVQQIGSATPLVAFQADVPRNPASVIKLVTTFAALDTLGPAYRWYTEAFVDSPLEGGTLSGDLILRGRGDPYLVTERLWLFQRELRRRGLRHIKGDLVIDNTWFAREETDPGAFDGQPYRTYNTLPDALLVNFQSVNFLFRPDPVRGRVEVMMDPVLANVDVRNQMRLIRGGCDAKNSGISMFVGPEIQAPRITFSGALASHCPEYQLNRSVLEAPVYAYGVFRSLWEEQGGTLGGQLRLGQAPEGKRPFVRFESLPLAEVIRGVNKYSNNVMTRQIFLTIGAERSGPPATTAASREAVTAALARHGLDFPDLHLGNGAGLSRQTRISASSLGRLLLAARRTPFQAEFEASLSLAGLDGTTARRFRGDPMVGHMHLKTGSLNGVTAIAGYVHSQSGGEYVVVTLANQTSGGWNGGQEAQNALLRWVYRR